jgi:prepilin-type N-terminal cleavage/methylation domain-containing protein
MFKPLSQSNQGFTLVEVLVAILITTLFISVAMQGIVIAALFKAKAQESSEATTWIQEDLENVKYNAATFKYTSLAANANSGASSITVASADDFAVNDRLQVGTDTGIYRITEKKSKTTLNITPNLGTTQSQGAAVVMNFFPSTSLTAKANSGASAITVASVDNFAVSDKLKLGTTDNINYTISGIDSGKKTLTITPPLGTDKLQGDAVELLTMCNPTAQNAGFAGGLRNKVSGTNPSTPTNSVAISKNSNRTGKAFTLTRTTTLSSDAPYNVLQVSYTISPTSGGSSIANFYTEVIPDAALQCPK